MRARLLFLVRLYLALLLVFVLQKPLFMAADMPEDGSYGTGDYIDVAVNGLLLDIPMTGYLIALPLLVTVLSVWLSVRVPLRKIATPYYVLISAVISAIFISDIALYPFWQFKLDATIFMYLDSPKGAFASVSVWFIVWHTVLAVLVAAAMSLLLVKSTPKYLVPIGYRYTSYGGLRRRWERRKITVTKTRGTLLLIALVVPLAISIRGGLGESTANIGKVYFSEDTYLNHSAVNPTFSLIYSLDKTKNFADECNYFPEEKRKRIFDGLYARTDTPMDTLLNTSRPDVIVILMESFGGQFVEAVSGRKDISPNYNRLAKEGVIFTNCYSNSFRTDRGTVSALSGYPSFPTLSVMKLPVKSRTLPCLANTLKAEGYACSFLYGGDINFTNMQSYLRTGGYGSITSDVDFSSEERKDNAWGVNDDITFSRLYDIVKEQKRRPWHIGFLTLSSHEPFEVPYKRLDEKIPNAFAYTDDCLGKFVERIRKTPLWKNLLIVCIPDHGFMYPENITHEQHHHNTMLWIGGAVKEHRVISTLMNQSDMPATLLGQMRISHDAYTFSRDVTSREYQRYPFAFFTFKEGFAFCDSTGYTVYDLIGDKVWENGDATAGGGSQKDNAKREKLRTDKAKAIMQSFYDDIGERE